MSSNPPATNSLLTDGDPLPTAVVDVTIQQFRPMGGIFPCFADFALAPGQPPVPGDTDSIYFTVAGQPDLDATLTLDVNSFAIDAPSKVAIVFRMEDWNYIFLGVAWASSDNSVGRLTFPNMAIQNLPPPQDGAAPYSLMTVVDDPTADTNSDHYYRYIILVQNAVTGEIGMIDPSIKNKPQG